MPGGVVCSVATCKSNSKKAKESGETLSFFSFPRDSRIEKEWIRKCYRKDAWNVKNKRICSKHFKGDDFEDVIQAQVMNTQPKKLKKDAIPSLFLLDKKEPQETERSKRVMRKQDKMLVEDLISEKEKSEERPLETITEDLDGSLKVTESEHDILKRKLEDLQRENLVLKQKIEQFEIDKKLLQQHVSSLEEQIKKDCVGFEDKAKIAFKDFLSPNQVEIALKKKSKARWDQEDLSKAFTLRYFSKRAYVYLRNTLHYPLPGLSTLQQWAANVNLISGVLEDVLRIMEISGKNKPNPFRATVLSYDEVKISSLYEYHEKEDEVFGPHFYMQVIMARGLFSNWKQPVYIGFDQKMTKDLLETVMSRLHGINYHVVACTSDCGGGNQGLWKAMGVTEENTFAEHPVTKKPVYFFADVPHLLKLLRNWFLDTGFILEDKTVINKDPVKILIEDTRSEISSCYKLTPLHLTCEKAQRQNVKLAAQLFSNTTATALKHYLPGGNKLASKKTGEFFQLVNNWFDVMNSYSPSSLIPSKKPYGTSLETQNEVLKDMISVIGKMMCTGKKSLQIFQRGILMSTKSLQGLFATMKQEYGIKYILTHRLNQDCLENFFCQIRTRGGLHDHPSPLNAIYRIRIILLGKNPGLVAAHSNVQNSPGLEDDEYLLASAIKQARLGNIEIADEHLEQSIDEEIDTNSSTSSSSTISQASDKKVSEKDGLTYIAGYLAKKHKEKYPDLGKYTYTTEEARNIHSYSHFPTWVQNLSFGGLIQPSEIWDKQCAKMDKHFQKLHKDTFSDKKKIVKKTVDYIARKVKDVPKELVKSFCRQRIFVRIKFLNMQNNERKAEKRKASSDFTRKIVKKVKKTVN